MTWTDEDLVNIGLQACPQRIPIPFGGPQDVASVLDKALAATPDAEALVGRHSRFTFRMLDHAINAAAAGMRTLDVNPGDRVPGSMGNHPELVIAFLATQRLGAIWVGINTALAPPEKAALLSDSGASLLVADRCVSEQIRALPRSELRHIVTAEPGDESCGWALSMTRHRGSPRPVVRIDPFAPAAIAYTSGTTGTPKGAVHSQHNLALVGHARHLQRPASVGMIDGVSLPLSILNVMTLGPLTSFQYGGKSVCIDGNHAVAIADWVSREKIDALLLVSPTMIDLLTNPAISRQSLASLMKPGVGGSQVPDTFRTLYRETFGQEILFGYGLTEAPTAATQTIAAEPYVPGSSGVCFDQVRVVIVDGADNELPQGADGEVCIAPVTAGPWKGVYTPMLGYWNKPEATVETLRNGLLHTGDIGSVDAHGHLYIKDRAKDVIIRGGANIYPAEIERVLLSDHRVAACAVLAKKDVRLGEIVVAAVQAAPGAADPGRLREELTALCLEQLAKYKLPAEWHFVRDMPRNAMRKIVKSKLAKMLFEEKSPPGQ
ncbi:MAG TPA: class I adenylate-forming enzyme family protein [Steroidobacteraceae bacterium]|jgi:acyl-CoA synthetase (AMP-forming)/AMP-acid ligase II